MVARFLKKQFLFVFAVLCTLVFSIYFYSVSSHNHSGAVRRFQRNFSQMEGRLDSKLAFYKKEIGNHGISPTWQRLKEKNTVNIHVYERDSLVFWNTNQLPIIRFADIHFPSEGLIHLQNGWYYGKMVEVQDFVICASFLIKNDYTYENRELINSFSDELPLSYAATISLELEKGNVIKNQAGEPIFALVESDFHEIHHATSVWVTLLLVFVICIWLFWLSKRSWKYKWVVPLVVVLFRFFSVKFEWFDFMSSFETHDPSLFATNELFPHFLAFMINCAVIVYVLNSCLGFIKRTNGLRGRVITIASYVLSPVIWVFIVYLTKVLIENSSIPLVIDKLFSLNAYSLMAIGSIGVLFFMYYRFVRGILEQLKSLDVRTTTLAVGTFIGGCAFLFYEIGYNDGFLSVGLFPLLFYGLLLIIVYRKKSDPELAAGLMILLLFSMVTAVSIGEFNRKKERGERELYANRLATEKNVETEAEYSMLSAKLKEDNFLKKFIAQPAEINISDFQEGMERRLFNGFWERYEMSFNLFDGENKPLVVDRNDSGALFDELQDIIERAGEASELDSNIFFINDYTDQYSYIIRQELEGKNGERHATLFCTLKSKKIPEEIGFPRLLISQKANVLESLEAYSIAKYHRGKLVTKYGKFSYPSTGRTMIPRNLWNAEKGFFQYDEFNHYLLARSPRDLVILSLKDRTTIDLVTSFSYLFSFFGLMLLPLLFRVKSGGGFRRTLSLAMKIQMVLIALVFVSLLSFGWGSGIFVRNQYSQYTDDVIREKLNSVQTEVRAKLGSFEKLTIDENGNYMQYILQKFAKVFFTDINLYDNNGYILATSRPKVFNSGLLSEQMNPLALREMKYNQKSDFVHNESIGELDYASAYLPFYNNQGTQMGFINLQHFGQQRELENQIQNFLVAIINVFILLLAISIVLAIFISNWLTSPLRILQESFANVEFGKQNEQILYDKEDEIGALVKDYNQKLVELEFAANQLAKNERESAWREMAKQVAHEIKNPLTPMKLSVQQLLRVYNPDDPKSGEKLTKVASSIIEQIDALTRIANEFSNFAKMPNPSEERMDVVGLIEGVREMFVSEEQVNIVLKAPSHPVEIMADRNQFIRVFNNLIKNAIQAMPSDRESVIDISVKRVKDVIHIDVTDNGVGIAEDQKVKIFVPYFTTKSTGTGLGLAMVRQIIENHKGTIDFESEDGKGTTFMIRLPAAE